MSVAKTTKREFIYSTSLITEAVAGAWSTLSAPDGTDYVAIPVQSAATIHCRVTGYGYQDSDSGHKSRTVELTISAIHRTDGHVQIDSITTTADDGAGFEMQAVADPGLGVNFQIRLNISEASIPLQKVLPLAVVTVETVPGFPYA